MVIKAAQRAVMAAVVATGAMIGTAATGQEPVTVVEAPPAGRSQHYPSNREPLAPSSLIKLPVRSIKPKGWLRGQLELMRDGMTGHLAEVSHWVQPEGNAWLSKTGEGKNGWEEVPYWLKGITDLGFILEDERLIGIAKSWCAGVMDAQREDGYFGSEENRGGGPERMQLGAAKKNAGPDLWPHMPMLDALRSYHEATGDPRVIGFMTRYFKWQASLPREQLLPGSWQKIRGGDNLDSVLWLYNRTGEAWLLDLARVLHENTAPWKEKIVSWHGVNICQGYREPAVWWQVSKDPTDLAAAERNYQEVMGLYGQVPGGMFGADEHARRGYGDPRQAAETCSMVEFMGSFQQLLRITGEGIQADRCEDVAFNSLPAAFTADYRALHYLTSPNMVQLDRRSKSPGLSNGGTMISYDPGRVYRCCQHNHAMGWPYYAGHLWMATADHGLAAVLYAECEVTAKVADGITVRLSETTEYPFDSRIAVTVHAERTTRFPIYLRVPTWCPEAKVSVISAGGDLVASGVSRPEEGSRGEYLRVEREWSEGDRIELDLAMETRVVRWEKNQNAASVRRGPLWYSLKISERYEPYEGSSSWPAYEVYPTTPWNYGLVLESENAATALKFTRKPGPVPAQPWTADAVPVEITAVGKRIPAWQQDRTGLVTTLQPSPVRSSEPEEQITLIPMGAARLRISAFPVIGEGPDAHEWTPPPPVRHDASYEYDDINALSDGREPKDSNDHSIPRFTWWDHRGTTEWVTYKFDTPRRVSAVAVYWFDDTGRGYCRVPASWRLLYRDGETWREVSGAGEFGVKADQYNRVAFDPVETTALKLEVRLQEGFSGGILEWKVE